ncbi:MAG: glycosyltransferase [Firmicutes bacterium]|nr:glycosyltransferase [Alicyclobacillaceae bacterium]MCL6497134.1 glycosyltransferase [Bacillota bacterium]
MRVLWVLPDAGPSDGARLAAWAIPVLVAGGAGVEVLPLKFQAHATWDWGVPVLESPLRGGFSRRLQLTGLLRRALSRYDRVVVDQDLDLELAAAMARGRGARAALVGVAHIPLTPLLAARGEHQVAGLRQAIARRYPLFDRWLAVSAGVGEDLVLAHRVPAGRVSVVPPPLPWPLWEAGAGAGPPPDWPFRDGLPVVATLGHLDHLKGVAVLLQALKVLEDRGRGLNLVVLGDGPERPALEQLARSLGLRAFFAGWRPERELARWLACCQIYVAPQYFDGAALDVWTAMGQGLPVVATDGPTAPSEVLGRGRYGRVVALGEPMALVEEIERWLDEPKRWEDTALKGYQRARGYAAERVASEWWKALGLRAGGSAGQA